MASSIAASSAERRKDFTRGDAASAVAALEHQRAVMIEVKKAAVDGQLFEADADRLADAAGAAQPGRAHRWKPFLSPAFGPKREMRRERFEQGRRGHSRDALIGERGRGVFEIARRRDEIDADPD